MPSATWDPVLICRLPPALIENTSASALAVTWRSSAIPPL